ncbi:MAG TPA: DUF222 domain-containing protein [Streptosporangiaceae bacterium]
MGEQAAGPSPTGDSGALAGTPPGIKLAGLLHAAAGPGERYASWSDDCTVLAAGRWDTVESWCVSRKLAVIRELIRRNPEAGYEAEAAGGLPAVWQKDLIEQVALELAITKNAADKLISLAWTLERRLPLTAAALDSGILNLPKARMVADETAVLSDADAREAEKLAAGTWQGKTWSQIRERIARAVVEVDPAGAEKRREQAEREEARVSFWREHAGTAALAGYGLPTDEALMAHQNIQARALAYKRYGIKEPLDLLRVMAMLDLLNGTDARTRYPEVADDDGGPRGGGGRGPRDGQETGDEPGSGGGASQSGEDESQSDREDPGTDRNAPVPDGDGSSGDGPSGDGNDDDGGYWPSNGGPGNGGPGNGGPGSGGPGNGGAGPGGGGLAANLELTVPLATLLGLAERPGQAHGLGVMDPGLARRLAAQATQNPRRTVEVIVTDEQGRAIGYGKAAQCRKPQDRKPQDRKPRQRRRPERDAPPPAPRMPGRSRDGAAMAAFALAGTGPDGGYGTWRLDIGDLELAVKLVPIPHGDCDHRYESQGYRPGQMLRRLVQVRDGECTMPVCVRHPRGTDFEHAVPWPAGRTCCCNGGARCRRDHRIKQSRGWAVEQLPGGRHQWTTPAGLTYTNDPKQYPV